MGDLFLGSFGDVLRAYPNISFSKITSETHEPNATTERLSSFSPACASSLSSPHATALTTNATLPCPSTVHLYVASALRRPSPRPRQRSSRPPPSSASLVSFSCCWRRARVLHHRRRVRLPQSHHLTCILLSLASRRGKILLILAFGPAMDPALPSVSLLATR